MKLIVAMIYVKKVSSHEKVRSLIPQTIKSLYWKVLVIVIDITPVLSV